MNNSQPYILCADDDLYNLEIIEDHLEDLYEVKSVENGQECIDSIQERIPDLILLDVMMPVMDGKETCKWIKSSPKYKEIPIIVLSANSYQEDIEVMLELGIDSYITKPFSRKDLLDRVADYI